MVEISSEQREIKNNTLTVKGKIEPVYLVPERGMVVTPQQGIILDLDAENIRSLLEFSRELAHQSISLPEKIQIIIGKAQLLRYASKETINEITNERAKQWVKQIRGFHPPIKLSEIIENGYGLCNDRAVLAWVLSYYGGIKTSLANGDVINHRIFKNSSLDAIVPHVWCEYFDPETQKWFPFDPTAENKSQPIEVFNQFYQPMGLPLPRNIEALDRVTHKPVRGFSLKTKQPLLYPRSELEIVEAEITAPPGAELFIKDPPLKFLTREEIIKNGIQQFRIFVPSKIA